MKIGIITDIHSNKVALDKVLDEFEKRKVDKIICCGDIIGIGPYPEETIQMLLKYKDKLIAVRGNHEQYLIKGIPKIVHENREMDVEETENHKWIHRQISEKSKEFLMSLPMQQTIEVENKKIYVVHYPMDEKGKYKKPIKRASLEENKEMFSNINADIYLYGHTHTVNINTENDKWYINPGSLGCPLASNIANCGIINIENGKIDFEKLDIEYNVEEIIQEIRRIKFPFYKQILKIFYGVK